MTVDYRIWGRIEAIYREGFLAIASAVREDFDPAATRVLSEVHSTREAAEVALRGLMITLGEAIRHDGGRVVDVETDGI